MSNDMAVSVVMLVAVGTLYGVAHVINEGVPWSPVSKARAARKKRWNAYYIEYLGYGYNEGTSHTKADAKMAADAKAADTVLGKEE